MIWSSQSTVQHFLTRRCLGWRLPTTHCAPGGRMLGPSSKTWEGLSSNFVVGAYLSRSQGGKPRSHYWFPTLPGRPRVDLSFPGTHSSHTDPQSTVTREDLESGCNHPGRREHILKRDICAPPFGYQIIETLVPKEMEFP